MTRITYLIWEILDIHELLISTTISIKIRLSKSIASALVKRIFIVRGGIYPRLSWLLSIVRRRFSTIC